MSSTQQTTIKRILKVNHAGEYGAIAIYRAQLFMAKLFYKDLVPFLSETLEHEISHCQQFRNAMPNRNARPCKAMWLWSLGGYLLGIVTSLAGRNAIMICTASVERSVHRHLEEQLLFLKDKDRELYALIQHIQKEEIAHLQYAEHHASIQSVFAKTLDRLVTIATHCVIWLSTWGDVSRMAKDIHPL